MACPQAVWREVVRLDPLRGGEGGSDGLERWQCMPELRFDRQWHW